MSIEIAWQRINLLPPTAAVVMSVVVPEDSLVATSTLLRCSMQLCRLFSRLLVV